MTRHLAAEDPELRPVHVYLFVHAHEQRFKIGVSVDPEQRRAALQERDHICPTRSRLVSLPSRERAYQVERALHKALAPSRCHDRPHSGGTEWFDLDALPLATRLLQGMPRGPALGAGLNVVPLHLATGQDALAGVERLALRNACRAEAVAELWLQVRDTLALSVFVGEQRDSTPTQLVLRGFRHAWDEPMAGLRHRIVNLETYQLEGQVLPGARPRPWTRVKSLVRRIDYLKEQPDDLVLELESLRSMARWPGGDEVSAAMRRAIALIERDDRDRAPRPRETGTRCRGARHG